MLIFSIIIAFFGSFLFGYTTCVMAGALLFLVKEFHLSTIQEGGLVSIILFGAMIGSAVGSKFKNRRQSLVCTGLIFIIGILLSMVSQIEILFLGRGITGIAVGLASMIVPLYLAEISPARYRGTIGSMTMLGVALGLLFAYIVNYFLSQSGDWQSMFGWSLVPAIIFSIGMHFALDSPRVEKLDDERKENSRLWDFPFRHLVIIGILLGLSQQLTGINAVNYYAPKIFQSIGFNTPQSSSIATLSIGFITVFAALLATWLMDKLGRRPLLLMSLAGMILSLGILSIAYFAHSSYLSVIALIALPTYAAAFTIGMGSALWVYLSEMFPSSIRSKAMSLAVLFNWLGNYLISLLFPKLEILWGIGGVFALFTGLCFIMLFFIYGLPETKGKVLN